MKLCACASHSLQSGKPQTLETENQWMASGDIVCQSMQALQDIGRHFPNLQLLEAPPLLCTYMLSCSVVSLLLCAAARAEAIFTSLMTTSTQIRRPWLLLEVSFSFPLMFPYPLLSSHLFVISLSLSLASFFFPLSLSLSFSCSLLWLCRCLCPYVCVCACARVGCRSGLGLVEQLRASTLTWSGVLCVCSPSLYIFLFFFSLSLSFPPVCLSLYFSTSERWIPCRRKGPTRRSTALAPGSSWG